MIRFIAALDSKNGIANNGGIPWQGQLPTDVAYFRSKTLHSNVMMGYGWYVEQKLPLPDRRNIVAYDQPVVLRSGFELTTDARKFIQDFEGDIWIGGGAMLFANTLDLADELYLTRIEKDFACTKFFPNFKHQFELAEQTEPATENNISFVFQIWKRKAQKQPLDKR